MMPLASHLNNRARQVAEFVSLPDAVEKLEVIQSPMRKLILRAILATPGLPEYFYRQLITKPYGQKGYNVLGVGVHAVTVSDGPSMVRKFYPESEVMSEEQKLDLMAKWEAKQRLNLTHLGAFTLEQNFAIESHPFAAGLSIISATQPRVDIARPILLGSKVSGDDPAASVFVAESLAMYEATSKLSIPDVVGRNNLVVDANTGSIQLIDTIALTMDDAEDAGAYSRSLAALGISDQEPV